MRFSLKNFNRLCSKKWWTWIKVGMKRTLIRLWLSLKQILQFERSLLYKTFWQFNSLRTNEAIFVEKKKLLSQTNSLRKNCHFDHHLSFQKSTTSTSMNSNIYFLDKREDFYSKWSILKWPIFRSDHFFELTFFSKWHVLRSNFLKWLPFIEMIVTRNKVIQNLKTL